MGRKRHEQITFDFTLTFVEGTPEYDAAYYLNNGPIPYEEALVIAIAAMYSMVGAAMRGADEQIVRDRISYSEEAVHGYQMRALGRLEKSCSGLESIENNDLGISRNQNPDLVNQNEAFSL